MASADFFSLVKVVCEHVEGVWYGDVSTVFTESASAAAEHKHFDIVKYFVPHKVTDQEDLSSVLGGACKGGDLSIVEYLIYHGAQNRRFERDDPYPIASAARAGHLHIIQYFFDRNIVSEATSPGVSIECACKAAEGGHLDVVKYETPRGYRTPEI